MRRAWPAARIARACCALGVSAALGGDPGPPAPAPAEAPPAVRGVVRDAAGVPLGGATVRVLPLPPDAASGDRAGQVALAPWVATTAEGGAFRADGLDGSVFRVRVEAPGHAPASLPHVPRGQSIDVRLERGKLVRGRTLVEGSTTPIPGARVELCDQGAVPFSAAACGRVSSDERGEFVFDGAPDGPLYVRATAALHAASRALRVEPGVDPIGIGLGPGAWIRGVVHDHRDVPLEGARVRVTREGGTRDLLSPEIWPITSDAAGRFVVPGLAAGEGHVLHAERPDRPAARTEPFPIEPGHDLELRVRMPAAAALTLALVAPERKPVPDVTLFLQQAGSADDFGPLASAVPATSVARGHDGSFTIHGLEAGRFDLLVVPVRYAELRRNGVELVPGETTDLGALTLDEGRTIAGRVIDPEGEPIEGAAVRAWDGGPLESAREATSGSEGGFEIAGLRTGSITLHVEAQGFLPGQLRVEEGLEEAEVVLQPAAGLAGRVETSDGEAPPAFVVLVHAEAAGAAGPVGLVKQQSFSVGDGAWRIDDVGVGRYTVEVRAAGWAPGRRRGVEASAGEATEVPLIVLPRGLVVSGSVEVEDDGSPLAGATVAARQGAGFIPEATPERPAVVTDERGRFELAGLEPGPVTLRASYPGFAPSEIALELGPDSPLDEVRLALKAGGRLTGTVRDRDGLPLPDRTLLLTRGSDVLGGADESAVTGADGTYDFPHVVAGSHTLRLLPASQDGFEVVTKTAVVSEGGIAVVDFEPEASIRLSGFVLDDERPLAHAQLFFTPASGLQLAGVKLARADGDGRYEVALDAPGRYRVMVQTGVTGGSSTEVDVPEERDVVRDIALASAGISGTVTDEDGAPVPGAAVAARPEVESEPLGEALLIAETDDAGRYAIQGLADGVYRVTAVASGYRVGEVHPVTVDAARGTLTVDLRLEGGRRLHGLVVDPQGRGIAGAYVFGASSASPDPLNPASAETDVNGAFEMTSPADGPLDLSVFAAGWAPSLARGLVPDERGEHEPIVLHVRPGGRLRVQVVDHEGHPVAGVHLLARPVPAFVGSEIGRLLRPPPPTDAAGVAWIELLSRGNWEIAIVGQSDVAPLVVPIDDGAEREALLRLPASPW
jgi:protocatechuate 3,4-dioxygenase beta subunit